ncbi:hypothetical protein PCASD_10986 [Puccinia coronata f. sp. avenae]|uniref:Uncharacterized protein n=1 Tax=Puccinia coronata f. sp. avenae TaxID=200324 RepID=A0A2N5TEP5_9BASI|nr:hypothetical protein PCASD_10986 [Puccinia coronata f. sp. avenae]
MGVGDMKGLLDPFICLRHQQLLPTHLIAGARPYMNAMSSHPTSLDLRLHVRLCNAPELLKSTHRASHQRVFLPRCAVSCPGNAILCPFVLEDLLCKNSQIGQPTDRTTSGHIQYRCLRPLLLTKTRLPQTISSSFLLGTIRDYETLVHPIDTSSPTISPPEPSSDGPGHP